jgi:hypothetical protein
MSSIDRGVVGGLNGADLALRCSQNYFRLAECCFRVRHRRVGNDAVQRCLLRSEIGLLLLEQLSGRVGVDLRQHLAGCHMITDPNSQ